ncbi:amidohydrolase family protein [Allomuricauda sp. CP2A]|jgi:predicted TIM-barrel fold metal-dependent hydrolase|uniref:amidohydrolase family protein n=1 Tax=Allomuricauda sp. CP2A TaxID=1848189 RepID=UPI00082AB9AB|nr:amidohydrolase family protein [Muricauda sp. CP2A]
MKTENLKNILYKKKAIIDVHAHIGISPKFYFQYGYPYALSVEDLIIRMDLLGIDYSVAFPFVDSAYYVNDIDSPKIETTTQYCNFPFELENRNLVNEVNEIFPEYTDKILPFLMFDPSRDAEKQAIFMEEISDRYHIYGIKTATTYIQAFVNDLETVGRPILEFVRKKNIPIIFHSSVHPEDPWASAIDIVNLAERNPDIRICIAHSARFMEPVLKKADRLDNCFVDFSAFVIHCKLAVQNSPSIATENLRFRANYNDPISVMTKMAETYPNTMIWGSDTPFNYWIQKYYMGNGELTENRLDCHYREEADILHGLPEPIKNKIAYENNLRFLFGALK